ncbi:MAG: putative signaling protein [Chloroflexi bacterium]|nr:MAG: putative signaling protein [Chloroflexota bacterium]
MKILCIEDDPQDADLMRRALVNTAPQTTFEIVSTQREGLKRLSAQGAANYDIVLTDLKLTDGDGLAILSHIRRRGLPLAVVVVTGTGDEETAVTALKGGADDYVVKRTDFINQLPKVLENALQRYRSASKSLNRQLRVLYAEHNATDIDLTLRHMRKFAPHFQLKIVKSNEEALDYLIKTVKDEANAPDVLLLDYSMPGNNALALMKQVQEIRGLDMPIVLVTGQGDEAIAAKVIRLGAADYIVKNPGYLHRLPVAIENAYHRTQWAREQAALRESEARLELFFAQSLDGFFFMMLDEPVRWDDSIDKEKTLDYAFAHQRITKVNDAMLMQYRTTRDQYIGLTPADFFAHDLEQGRQVWREFFDAGRLHVETDERRLDGTQMWIEGDYICLYDAQGRITGHFGVQRDVTATKQTAEELQRQVQELSVLNMVAVACTKADDLDTLLENVTQIIFNSLYPDTCGVLLFDEASGLLTPHPSYHGVTREVNRDIQLQLGQGVIGQVAASRQPMRVADVRLDPQYFRVKAETLSELCAPITLGERLLGAVNVESNSVNFFSAADESLLVTIAGTLATAIEKLRLFESEHTSRQQSETLRMAAAALTSSLELGEVLDGLLVQLAQVIPYDSAALFLKENNHLRSVAGRGFAHPEKVISKKFLGDDPLTRDIYETRRPLILPDVKVDERWQNWGDSGRVRGWLGVPLVVREKVIGHLTVDSFTPDAFNESHVNLAQAFASQAAAAIENARLFNETRQRLAELETINRISTALRTAQTVEEMLPRLLDETLKVLDLQAGSILLLNQERGEIKIAAAGGWCSQLPEMPMKASEGMAGEILKTGKPLISSDFASDMRLREELRSNVPAGWGGAGVPIRSADAIIGLLFVSAQLPRMLTDPEIRLLTTITEMAGNAIQRARLHDQTMRQVERLKAIHTVDETINASLDLRLTLNILLEQVVSQLDVDSADILLFNPSILRLEFAAGRGFRSPAIESFQLRLGTGLAGRAALEKRTITQSFLHQTGSDTHEFQQMVAAEGFETQIVVPLVAKGEIKGVLEIFQRNPLALDPDDMSFLETMAAQAAMAVNNSQLFDGLQRSNIDLSMAYDATIEGWSKALDLRDKETEGHTQRVSEMTIDLSEKMGMNQTELVNVRRGALLHDIGKMGITDAILLKPGPLTDEEGNIMRKHPALAFEMLSPIAYLREALDIPYCHHEKWDGSGYPRGLKGSQIPLAARVFTVVDVYDALTSDRSYRKAWKKEKALAHIKEGSGSHFDPAVVKAFLEMVGRF